MNQGDLFAKETEFMQRPKSRADRSQSLQSSGEVPYWGGSEGRQEGGDVTDRTNEAQRAAVSEGAKQAGEIWQRWNWVERTVWTERMWTALEEGVRGGKWFSLMDKVWRQRTLWAAFQQVAANDGAAGVDHQTVEDFERNLSQNLQRLSEQLQQGTYQPQPVRRVWIPKPGSTEKRPLGVPAVRDRVVQAALRLVLEPIFERDFAPQSYGFRPQRGCLDALRRVDQLLKQG